MRWTVVLVAASLVAASCSGDDEAPSAPTDGAETTTTTGDPAPSTTREGETSDPSTTEADAIPEITTQAGFEGFGSVEQAYVLGAEAGQELLVVDADGDVAGSGTANELGSLVVHDLAPGDGYTFRAVDGDEVAGTDELTVLAPDDHPDTGFYEQQELEEGLNYITTRDGVELAATVRLPDGMTLDDGPFPTVIEYSGYETAAPGDFIGSVLNPDEVDPDLPLPAQSTALGSAVAPLLGFASVSLQMRGTGCSAGAFGLFDTLAALDGYDAIETVAAQPWVKGGQVGMIGISFSGISQLVVAGTQPPSLAAITPLSVTDDLYSTGFPGGIRNDGFAESWLADRTEDAKPASEGGQPWAQAMIELGDERCAANQALHPEALSIDETLGDATARTPELYDERSPTRWAQNIEVPTFLVSALQDEQTGGQWTNLIASLAGNDDVWITLINGPHVDSLGPGTVGRMIEFLDLYVADELPSFSAGILGFSGLLYDLLAGAPSAEVEPLRFTDAPSTEAARKQFADDPRIRVLFENGGGNPEPGALGHMWEDTFDEWPPAAATPTEYSLTDNGGLTDASLSSETEVSYRPDASARAQTTLSGADPWVALPDYRWEPVTGDSGLGFATEPLEDDLTLVGPATLELSLQSTADDTDVQVAVSEVRPDGQEMYVQSGYLRASHRALDEERSTELFSMPTYTEEDAEPLPEGEFTTLRVPIGPLAHTFRAGSQLRITITAPGGDRPEWTFDTPETAGDVTNTVRLGGADPSRLILPVVPGVEPGAGLPPCPSLRGQPCRRYEPAGNGG